MLWVIRRRFSLERDIVIAEASQEGRFARGKELNVEVEQRNDFALVIPDQVSEESCLLDEALVPAVALKPFFGRRIEMNDIQIQVSGRRLLKYLP